MPCGERLFPLAAVERLNPKLREEFQRYFCCYTVFLLLLELFGEKSRQSKNQHLRQRESKLISNWDSWRLITEKPMHNWFPVRNNIHQFIHDNETRTYVNQKLKLTWFHRQQHKLSAYWRIERQTMFDLMPGARTPLHTFISSLTHGRPGSSLLKLKLVR